MQRKFISQQKDYLEVLQAISTVLIPCIALIFTIVFSWMELKNQAATRQLTASNIKLARAQVKVSLIPLLTSTEPGKRAIALYLSEQLDEQFSADVKINIKCKNTFLSGNFQHLVDQ